MIKLSGQSRKQSTFFGTGRWISATRYNPCGACGRFGEYFCRVSEDGGAATCRHESYHKDFGQGHEKVSENGERYYSFVSRDGAKIKPQVRTGPPERHPDQSHYANTYAERLTEHRAKALADQLGFPGWFAEKFKEMGFGWSGPRKRTADKPALPEGWRFPERDGQGRAIGFSIRTEWNAKRQDGPRGMHLPPGWFDLAVRKKLLLVVEGASDTAACYGAGVSAIGIPALRAGREHLTELLAPLPDFVKVVMVAERDEKPDGFWPGLIGSRDTAKALADELGRPVGWALIPGELGRAGRPAEFKDSKDWLVANAGTTELSWRAAGDRYARLILADATFEWPGEPDLSVPAEIEHPECQCRRPSPGHLAGKRGSPREGFDVYTRFRCKKWVCGHCRTLEARKWYVHLRDILVEADAAGDGTRDKNPHPSKPIVADHLRLYFGEMTPRQFAACRESVTSAAGEYARMPWRGLNDTHKGDIEENKESAFEAESHDEKNETFRVFAVVPPDQRPPRFMRPVCLAEALALLAQTMALLRPDPEKKACHPVRTSKDWNLPEREPSHWTVGKVASLTPEQITEAASAVGLSATVNLRHEDVRGHQAGVAGPPVYRWLFNELVAKRDDAPAPSVGDVVNAYWRWKQHLPANAVPCWNVKDVIESRLWEGPDAPTLVRLADAIERAPELEQFFRDTEGIEWPGEQKPPPKPKRIRPSSKDRRFQARLRRAKNGDGNPILDTIRH